MATVPIHLHVDDGDKAVREDAGDRAVGRDFLEAQPCFSRSDGVRRRGTDGSVIDHQHTLQGTRGTECSQAWNDRLRSDVATKGVVLGTGSSDSGVWKITAASCKSGIVAHKQNRERRGAPGMIFHNSAVGNKS